MSGVDERVHMYILTYGQSVICFYIMGLGANFTMREVVSSANICANCYYNYISGHIEYLRHSVSIGNRFPWLHCVKSVQI